MFNILSLRSVYRYIVTTFFIASTVFQECNAGQGAASTGYWRQSSSWTIDGTARTPTCGDTLTIPAGVILTVDNQQDYESCGQSIHIIVAGSFQFVNGYKLKLPCSSSLSILPGGELKKATSGGGNSTFISICGCVNWAASMGPISGPASISCTTLPVNILSFTAEGFDEDVHLSWVTATEINNQFFTIERSKDGINFTDEGMLSGAGNSSVMNSYTWTDNSPLLGVSYYRIKQTDFDGRFSHSDIIPFRNNSKKTFSLASYSFEQDNLIVLNFNDPINADLTVYLNKIDGEELLQTNISLMVSDHFEIEIPELASGLFILRIMNKDNSIYEKLFIQ